MSLLNFDAFADILDEHRPRTPRPIDFPTLKMAPRLKRGCWVTPLPGPADGGYGWDDGALKQMIELMTAQDAPLETACQLVMAQGVSPADCLIETRFSTGDAFDRHVTLKVMGEPVFEVQTARRADPTDPCKFNLTISPRWLKLPRELVRTEPNQSRRHPPGSGGDR